MLRLKPVLLVTISFLLFVPAIVIAGNLSDFLTGKFAYPLVFIKLIVAYTIALPWYIFVVSVSVIAQLKRITLYSSFSKKNQLVMTFVYIILFSVFISAFTGLSRDLLNTKLKKIENVTYTDTLQYLSLFTTKNHGLINDAASIFVYNGFTITASQVNIANLWSLYLYGRKTSKSIFYANEISISETSVTVEKCKELSSDKFLSASIRHIQCRHILNMSGARNILPNANHFIYNFIFSGSLKGYKTEKPVRTLELILLLVFNFILSLSIYKSDFINKGYHSIQFVILLLIMLFMTFSLYNNVLQLQNPYFIAGDICMGYFLLLFVIGIQFLYNKILLYYYEP